MGFYAPAQIVRDAREHGVEVRPVCVNASYWDCTLEPGTRGGLALRLGLRQVKGLRREDGQWIPAARGNGYADIESLQRRTGLARAAIPKLANADAFNSSGLARRDALWQARALTGTTPLPLFAQGEGIVEPQAQLPAPSLGEQVVEDYRALRLSLRAHPLALLRERLSGGRPPSHTAIRIAGTPDGARIAATGLVITRQRPGTASGVIFLTLEDETGVINVIVWPKTYERFRRAVIAGRLLRITGKLQREGSVSHLIAGRIEDLSPWLDRLGAAPGPAGTETRPTPPRARHPREQARRLFPSRDFH